MTVMFCDLVDSTPLAELLDAEDLHELLGEFHTSTVAVVEQFEGHVAKYLGDGMLVYFGYPEAHEDDPRRAVQAGLEIQRRVVELNGGLNDRFDVELQVRIGIHTGMVVAGEMGAGQTREEFAIVGETPNIAARLESLAEPGTVVISAATQRLVEGYFVANSRGRLQLKGISRPIEVVTVTGETGAQDRTDLTSHRGSSPLVGRNGELDELETLWRAAAAGRGAVVHVSGEAGIGKSRLVREAESRLREAPHTTMVWRCSALHRNSVLHPVASALDRSMGLAHESTEEQRRRLHHMAHEAGLDDADVRALGRLLSIPLAVGDGDVALPPIEARATVLRLLETLVVSAADRRPLLLVVEDVHWADPTTIELLERLAVSIRERPILAILTTRPDDVPRLPPPDMRLQLRPLSPDAVAELISCSLPEVAERPDTAGTLIAAADGVPLFVEEMLRMLRSEQQAAERRDDLQVPPTLQSLLTARLDRLGSARQVVQIASVLGRDVHVGLLSSLLPSDTDVDATIERLVEEHVFRSEPTAGGLEFTHALIQESAYESLLRRDRRQLHARVAELLTVAHPETAVAQPELVAHHFSRAGEHRHAIACWERAGHRALANAAFAEAIEHFGRGLEAFGRLTIDDRSPQQELALLLPLAAARQAAKSYADPEAENIYLRAEELSVELDDDQSRVSVLRGQWMLYLNSARYERAAEVADRLLRLGERHSDDRARIEGEVNLGLVRMFQGELATARRQLESAIERCAPGRSSELYETLGDSIAGAHAYLALVLWASGEVTAAARHSDSSLRLASASGSPMTIAQAWGMRALYHLGRKEIGLVSTWSDRTAGYSRERSIPYWQHLGSSLSSWVTGRVGDLAEGSGALEASVDTLVGAGQRLGMPDLLVLLADLRRLDGATSDALDLVRRAEEQIASTGERFNLVNVLRTKGELLLGCDPPNVADAEEAFVRSCEVAREQGALLLELRATATLAKLRRRLGTASTMQGELASLVDRFPADCDVPDLAESRSLLAQLVSEESSPH